MEESYTIPRDRNLLKSMDFDELKKEGISLLQQFSGNIWTDYNDHDPGVTLLEQLCFSLTDVSYRQGFGIEEILHAGKDVKSGKKDAEDTFFSANRIFPSHPVTLKDYRKLLIDQIPEVKNAWIEPERGLVQEKKGIYKVYLQLGEEVLEKDLTRIKKEVTNRLYNNRNLGEDFGKIEILSYEEIALSVTIELKYNALGEEVLGKLLADLEAYLSPNVKKYSLQELLAEGTSLDKIMDGPLLYNGFIKDEDLLPRTQLLRKSKFTEIITSIDGAEKVSRFELLKNGITFLDDILTIPEGKIPRLFNYLDSTQNNLTSYIRFTKGGKPYTINPSLVNQIYASQSEKFHNTYIKHTDLTTLPALASKKPTYQQLNLKEYFSLQRFLPAIYGVGEFGLSREESQERVAKSKQLKAYLLLFDQLLANYLAQLTSLRTLFSLYDETNENIEQRRSYFFQPAFDVPQIETVLLREDKKESFFDEIKGHINDLEIIFKSRQIRFAWVREQRNLKEGAKKIGFNQAIEAFSKALLVSVRNKLSSETDEDQIVLRRKLEQEVLAFKMACIRSVFRKNLDDLMRDIDPYLGRRNQFLDHLLARFGERPGSVRPTLLAKETGGDFNQDLISSKLKVLKNYPKLSHTRSRGAVFLGKDKGVEVSGLQQKLGASLNFNAEYRRLAPFSKGPKLEFSKRKPTPAAQKSPNQFIFSIPAKNRKEFLATLVSHGLHDYNYEIVKVEAREKVGTGNYEIKFLHPLFTQKPVNSITHPDEIEYLTIYRARTRRGAEQALSGLVKYFNKLNRDGEGCHLVEHLLLRPKSPSPVRFEILDKKANVILKSSKARSKAVQTFIADNITLYATRGISLMKYQKQGKYKLFFGDEYLGYEILDPEALGFQPRESIDQKSQSVNFEWILRQDDENGNKIDAAVLIKEKVHLFDEQKSNYRLISRPNGKFEVVLRGENDAGESEDVGRLVRPHKGSLLTDTTEIQQEEGEQSNGDESEFLFDTEAEAISQRDKVIREFIDMRLQNKLISRLQMKTETRKSEAPEFYSQQCSLVFPNWPARFQLPEFKNQLEQLVLRNAPAHLKFNFIWLDPEQMKKFEDLYEKWHHLIHASARSKSHKREEILVNLDQAAQELASSLNQHIHGGQ